LLDPDDGIMAIGEIDYLWKLGGGGEAAGLPGENLLERGEHGREIGGHVESVTGTPARPVTGSKNIDKASRV